MADDALQLSLNEMRDCFCSNFDVEDEFQQTTDSYNTTGSGYYHSASSFFTHNLTETHGASISGNETSSIACAATTAGMTQSANDNFRRVEELLYSRIAVSVCMFGLIGNIGNFIILLPQGRHCSMGRIEKFAYIGLIALTVSDGLFCLTIIPQAFVEREPVVLAPDFSLWYSVYGNALINVFSMASTWITITLAVGRYLAICHPFRARELIGTTVAKRAIFVVYGACIVFNVPRFLTYKIEHIQCGDQFQAYFQWPGLTHVKRRPELERVYMWLYFVFGIGLPFVCLVASNVFLIRTLHVAGVRLQRSALTSSVGSRGGSGGSVRTIDDGSITATVERKSATSMVTSSNQMHSYQYRPITLTLVALVVVHVLLVSPAEFALFLRQLLARSGSRANESVVLDDWYNLIAAICNTLQAVNYSINFVLYYIINVHFRRAVVRLIRCCRIVNAKSPPVRRSAPGAGLRYYAAQTCHGGVAGVGATSGGLHLTDRMNGLGLGNNSMLTLNTCAISPARRVQYSYLSQKLMD